MSSATRFVAIFMLFGMSLGFGASHADTPPSNKPADSLPLFAIQVRVGPKWDLTKAPT
jgi:hypothetical protein